MRDIELPPDAYKQMLVQMGLPPNHESVTLLDQGLDNVRFIPGPIRFQIKGEADRDIRRRTYEMVYVISVPYELAEYSAETRDIMQALIHKELTVVEVSKLWVRMTELDQERLNAKHDLCQDGQPVQPGEPSTEIEARKV